MGCRTYEVVRRLALSAVALFIAALLVSQPNALTAQDLRSTPLSVFIDCQTFGCDRSSFRTEIPFVNWVLIQEDADVHVIVTSQSAGAGNQWIFDFEVAEGEPAGLDQLLYSGRNNDTDSERLDGLVRTLALGLASHAQARGFQGFSVGGLERSRDAATQGQTPVDDPWNSWVFRTSLNGSVDRESTRRFRSGFGSFSADRTTEAWRTRIQANANHRRSEFEIREDTVVSETNDWSASTIIVKSVGDHWGVGGRADVGSSTFRNQDLAISFGPAFEWNYFNYVESNRRRLVSIYRMTVQNVKYEEETLYEKTKETLLEHAFSVSYRARETWGEAEAGIETAQYLNHPGFWRVSIEGEIDFRLTRGLTVRFNADGSWIRNQRFLPGRDASSEEILLRQRRLSSDFDMGVSVGLSYTFGSLFNNVVNNRFPSEFGFRGRGRG